MHNIEIKARLNDLIAAHTKATALVGLESSLRLQQIDTYFNIGEGRLKLREKQGDEEGAELIFYRRDNVFGPKVSDYEIVTISEPDKIKQVLADKLGIKIVISKERSVYLIDNARIHLDEIEGLGTFIEIEIVISPDTPDAPTEALMSHLMNTFTIDSQNLLDCSYCDLMEANKKS